MRTSNAVLFKGALRILKALSKLMIMKTKMILITILPKKFKTSPLHRKPMLQASVMLPLHDTKSHLKIGFQVKRY